jgi:GH25 family lysozyme M1 (1,4-beta-N-acetylmuramidase)
MATHAQRLTVLDLSNNNPAPNFAQVKKAGAFGVLLKVSEATTFTDDTWPERSRQARAAGLHVGGYHFARPHPGSALEEAHYFTTRLGHVQRRDLHPALDLETNEGGLGSAELLEWVRSFQTAVRRATGTRCLLYTYSAFVQSQAWPRTPGTGAGLWLADYGPNDGTDHGTTPASPWRRLVAHQFTSTGTWPGCEGHVDLSHARSRRRLLARGARGL